MLIPTTFKDGKQAKNWYIKVFNNYRTHYDSLQFNQKKKFYSRIESFFPQLKNFYRHNLDFIKDCLEPFKPLKVVELGGGNGELMSEFPEYDWVNFDFHNLTDNLWVLKPELDCNLFISCHTIEHFSNREFESLIEYLHELNPKYILLNAPLLPDGQSWHNYFGLHVLTYGTEKVKSLLQEQYELVKKVPYDETTLKGWCAFWRKKDLKTFHDLP